MVAALPLFLQFAGMVGNAALLGWIGDNRKIFGNFAGRINSYNY
jgi:hypothetical protein